MRAARSTLCQRARALSIVGTPADVADFMEHWVATDACDGFNVMPPYFNDGLIDFVDLVVPELQRRGIYRTAYEGTTLRQNLGLPVPASRYASATKRPAAMATR